MYSTYHWYCYDWKKCQFRASHYGVTMLANCYYLAKLYQKLDQQIEKARVVNVEYSNTIEQNTSGFSLIKMYNEQQHQKEKFEKINEENYKADYQIGVVKNKISNVINILYGTCYSLGFAIGVYLIQKNAITIGDLTVYISCI